MDPFVMVDQLTLTGHEVADRAGVDYGLARRVWRALGLPEVEDEDPYFDDQDVEALKALKRIMDLGVPAEDLLAIARVHGECLARIADAETRVFKSRLIDPMASEGADSENLGRVLEERAQDLVSLSTLPLNTALRRLLAVAMQQLMMQPSEGRRQEMCTGFVDLVDFTRIADSLQGEDLGELVTRFEDVVIERCADHGVRLVKIIGDAAMFVSSDPLGALRTARRIVDVVEQDETLPQARAGIDRGEVIALGGDYFGRPVNVASRITAYARPGTVVISAAILQALDGELDVGSIGKTRLKGIGRVELFKVRVSNPL